MSLRVNTTALATCDIYGDMKNTRENSEFVFREMFENLTGYPITFVRRDNVAFTAGKTREKLFPNKTVFVRRTYYVNSDMAFRELAKNVTKFNQHYGSQNKVIDLIRRKMNPHNEVEMDRVRIERAFSITLDFKINIDELLEYKRVYYPHLDLLVVLGDYDVSMIHPFSDEGMTVDVHQSALTNQPVTGLFVEVIDNDDTISKRFMYVGKRVLEIPVKRDPNRQTGVYYSHVESNSLRDGMIDPKSCSIEDAEDLLGLYPTKEDAITAGDPDKIFKAEMRKIEKDLESARAEGERFRQETVRLKDEAERRKLSRDEEAQKRSDQINHQAEIRKDSYDAKSAARKDNSELLKIGGAMLITGIGIWGLMRKGK